MEVDKCETNGSLRTTRANHVTEHHTRYDVRISTVDSHFQSTTTAFLEVNRAPDGKSLVVEWKFRAGSRGTSLNRCYATL